MKSKILQAAVAAAVGLAKTGNRAVERYMAHTGLQLNMILDKNLLMDTAAAISLAANASLASANVIDLLNARDMGIGDERNLNLMVLVTTSLLSTNSATIQIFVQGSTDATNFTNMVESDPITMANAVAGNRLLDVALPRIAPGQSLPRYLGMSYKALTGAITAGALTSGYVLDRQDYVNYPPGIVVAN